MYNYWYHAYTRLGAVRFARATTNSDIRACLDPTMLAQLDAIGSLSDAETFTNSFGTHLIIGVYLGGRLSISVTAETSSATDMESVHATVTAAYRGVGDISGTASATASLKTSLSSKSFSADVVTFGGDAGKAGNITATDAKSFTDWYDSCTESTVSGLQEAKELWMLAANDTAQTTLYKYIQLRILKHSINNPSFFNQSTPCLAGQETKVDVTPPSDYKIVGGGAALTPHDSVTSWLAGSYPVISNSGVITGWRAHSHDAEIAADPATQTLTAYAIAIYDPDNLISVRYASAFGANPGTGHDTATATLPVGYTLTGGGVSTDCETGSGKFLMSSYPAGPAGNNVWTGDVWDYQAAATNVSLQVVAIGISVTDVTLTADGSNQTLRDVSHGTAVATSPGPMIGGGVKVTLSGGGEGNLVRQTFPSTDRTWAEFNTDAYGSVTHADSTAYVMWLTAS